MCNTISSDRCRQPQTLPPVLSTFLIKQLLYNIIRPFITYCLFYLLHKPKLASKFRLVSLSHLPFALGLSAYLASRYSTHYVRKKRKKKKKKKKTSFAPPLSPFPYLPSSPLPPFFLFLFFLFLSRSAAFLPL
ncbi:hypothetical protein F4809DRAFT_621988 [Biscogniauxia mediterranea]|nr:hypothetical protein F4809DRAFT_621988 [Biscogniauxia mediterranea]